MGKFYIRQKASFIKITDIRMLNWSTLLHVDSSEGHFIIMDVFNKNRILRGGIVV